MRLDPVQEAEPGTLRGTVKDTRGKSVRRATVLIPGLDRTLTPKADGSFSTLLKAGEHSIIISAPGYRAQRKRLKISAGGTVILNVELHR